MIGRFQTNTRLCLSMSDYHPETWNPMWSVGTILTGLLSYMLENGMSIGALNMSAANKINYAKQSHKFNSENPLFCKIFPDLVNNGGPVSSTPFSTSTSEVKEMTTPATNDTITHKVEERSSVNASIEQLGDVKKCGFWALLGIPIAIAALVYTIAFH
jgi:hypothetical protein